MNNFSTHRVDESLPPDKFLDKKDQKIIQLLSEDGRMPYSVLSKKIKLSKETTFYRVKRLMDHGMVLGFVPLVEIKTFEHRLFHVFLVLHEQEDQTITSLIDRLKDHPNTKAISEYSDRWDIEWVLVASSAEEFDEIVEETLHPFTKVVLQKHKMQVLHVFKSTYLPSPAACSALPPLPKPVDEIDKKLIHALCHDGRASYPELAKHVKLSSDGVRYRIKRLLTQGVIRKFTLYPQYTKMGYHWATIALQVRTFDKQKTHQLCEILYQFPQIISAEKVLGDADLLFHVIAKDTSEMHNIIKRMQRQFADILSTHHVWGAYKEHYYTPFPKVLL